MKCPNCQAENRDHAKFCDACGAKLLLLCPACGQPHRFGARFCDECGGQLTSPEPSPSIDYNQPQSYTPQPLAQKIIAQRKQIEGERKLVTVFFADVASYTAMSEKLDPEEVHRIIDGWYQIVMDGVHRYEGTITQFMGDGVMALFGAPLSHEDHARRACLAGLWIQERVKGYAERVRREFGADFMREYWGEALVTLGRIYGKKDPTQLEKAESLILEAIDLIAEIKYKTVLALSYIFLGEFYADLGQKGKARESLEHALALYRDMEVMYWPDRARAALGRL